VVRGVVAALCCAAFFAILGLVYKFRWRPVGGNIDTAAGVSYRATGEEVTIIDDKNGMRQRTTGQDNPAMESAE
jgi:hypothetical protein